MKTLERVLHAIELVMEWLVYILVGTMVVNTAGGVFFRYVLRNALPWTEELGRYMMIWCGFIGCAFAMRDGSHVGVEMFVEIFKPGVRRVFAIAAKLVVAVFLVVILAKTGEQLGSLSIQKSSALMIPMVYPYAAVTFGIAMMLVYDLIQIVRLVLRPAAAK